ncbi:LysR family transcriptional regulator [Neptunomonas phycophila]|uniref:LysR family transcriptional regulator n=2 Tax=Neptunomonas phycophila TaxID=1572645 RepID=A0AAW7XDM1_9GAMM|nr:LysR family transcriptional regulator [Neptunomonas phycophila]MDO6452294.1 LysR family transcriptional regulator [Neptunomonas phycophila]
MLPINYRHLIAFIAVSRQGSFTQAAAHLHVTQSTLTATIKQLESQTGIQLLDRTTRRVHLTQAGERFFPVAERLVSDFDAALSDLKASALQQQGSVSLAASASVVSTLLPHVIAKYRQDFPNVAMTIIEEGASGIESGVDDNRADFGIGSNHSNQPTLHYTPLIKDQYGVVLPQDHPILDQNPTLINPSDITSFPQIFLTKDNGIRLQLDEYLQQWPTISKRAAVEATTPATLASLIKSGMGVSILPALAASTSAFTELTFVPLDQPDMYRELCLITRRGRSLSPAGEELMRRVIELLKDITLPPGVEKAAHLLI